MRLIDLLPVKELQPIKEMENPCWKGYQMVGTKKKDGREVPNCVPNNEAIDSYGASQPGGYFGDDADENQGGAHATSGFAAARSTPETTTPAGR